MRGWIIGLVVFVASAAVLVLEIVAGRILAPYVGVSLETFTGFIGTVLAAIALGAWAGGRYADRTDPERLLGPVLLVGGVLAVVSPALVYVIGPSVSGEDPITIVVLAAVGFFLPAAVLSSVTPIAAKISLGSVESTGSVVGRLSALGTAGALFGTFATGFVLIAAIPSQPITWVVGSILVVFGVVLVFPISRVGAAVGVVIAVVGVLGSAAIAAPCEHETAYSCAIVSGRSDHPTAKALILDTFVNSVVDPEDPTYLALRYAKVADAVVESSLDGPLDAIYIGGGGYTLPRYYQATRGSDAVVLELDGALPGIAVEELGLIDGPWLETKIGDARLGIRDLETDSYELVVGDAFSGRSVPWHLTTVEFIRDVEDRMTVDGLYVINVIDHPPTRFARSELATMAEVFDHVAVIAPNDYLMFGRGGNFVLVGSNAPIDAEAISNLLPTNEVILVDTDAIAWSDGGIILTDAFAPTDQLISRP
jgi:MFS family permease